MTPVQKILNETEDKMKKSLEASQREFTQVRTGRASTSIVDSIVVDYYGTATPLKQLANVSAPDAKMVVIHPWDPSAIGEIEKAILKSSLGITPNNDGKFIRLNVPPLTQERRDELVKVTKKMAEDGKVAIRTIRRDANEKAKKQQKDSLMTEDELKKLLDDVQKKTDKYIKDLDNMLATKEKEINEF